MENPLKLRRVARLPAIVLISLIVATVALPLYGPRGFAAFDVYNTLQVIAGPGLLSLGLGLTMIAGEFDLSTVGMYALGGMVAIRTGGSVPVLGVLLATIVGAGYGAAQGFLIAKTKLNSMALTLGGYIVLSGLTGVLGHDNPVSFSNSSASVWVDQTIFSIFCPRSLITIGAFLAVAGVLWGTRFGIELRAVGSDRRASRLAGVGATAIVTMVFTASAALSALGGALVAYSSATATPTVDLSPLIFGVTAVLLGGVTLSGGLGGALGIGAGVLALGLLDQIFVVEATASYVNDIVLGGLLIAAGVADGPDMKRARQRLTARISSRSGQPPPRKSR